MNEHLGSEEQLVTLILNQIEIIKNLSPRTNNNHTSEETESGNSKLFNYIPSISQS